MIDVVIPLTNENIFGYYAFSYGIKFQVGLWFAEYGKPTLTIMQDHNCIFRFDNTDLAMLFKLTWG
jgi:hypothetical protein